MKKTLLLLCVCLPSYQLIHGQSLTTVTGLRLYEHHSSAMNNGAPFGSGANGSQSGYDFVNRDYYNSFDTATFGEYAGGEEANIDMVEHRGPFGAPMGGSKKFGFTSGVSTIWNGDIKGNGTTKWMKAPASFNYASINNVSNISSVYNASAATTNIDSVEEGTVYLAKIRNTSLYVAMRCYNIHNVSSQGGVADAYFDFDYKYGTFAPTGITELGDNGALILYPNPASSQLTIKNTSDAVFATRILSIYGQEIQSFSLGKNSVKSIDISNLSSGVYFITYQPENGPAHLQKFNKR
jgi:hypothetical protein